MTRYRETRDSGLVRVMVDAVELGDSACSCYAFRWQSTLHWDREGSSDLSLRLRPSVISVMLEGAKSAEPPMNSGRTGAMALRQSWRGSACGFLTECHDFCVVKLLSRRHQASR